MILTPAQNIIAADPTRFRVLNCGRRFGKTSLAAEEIKGKALGAPNRIAYVAPTYQQARDIIWEILKTEMRPAIISINEARLEIKTKVIGSSGESLIVLRGWEAIETLRGQSFDLLVPDEVALYRNFWQTWQQVLRPTLADRKGHALFLSTPRGFNHFYDLYNLQEVDPEFKSFHFTTYDNPFIPPEEIDAARKQMTEDAFAQEFLADFRKSEGLVYKEFDREKHVFTDLPEGLTIVENIGGVDFGYTHKAAVLNLGMDNADGIWVLDEYYESGRTDLEVAEYVAAKGFSRVYADPESPAAIEEMRRKDVNIRPVVKGKDSESHGIDRIRERLKANKLHVHRSCVGLINEFETHSYKEDGTTPETTGEDALDALRYPIFMLQPEPARKPYVFVPDAPIFGSIGL